MHQHLDAAGCLQCQRVTGSMLLHDLAGAGGPQDVVDGINRNSVPGKFPRKNRDRTPVDKSRRKPAPGG